MKDDHDKPQNPAQGLPAWVPTRQFGDLRVGPILTVPAILTDLGVSPQRVFAKAGVDLHLFQDAEARIPLEAVGRLFAACVEQTGCGHFGLLVGERFELTAMGPLGYLMRHCATVGDAIRSLLLHLHLTDRGAAPVLLATAPGFVTLGYSTYRHGIQALDQIQDTAVAIGVRILRELCGPAWRPLRVQFSHGRPASSALYQRVLGDPVTFNAEISGILFDAAWLERPIPGADGGLHALVTTAIGAMAATAPMGFADQVQTVLHQMILNGTATAASVARLFGVPERTLRRRLQAEGRHLQQLINAERFEIAKQLLDNTDLPVAEVAAALHYADPNAFSRAFRGWAGLSPLQWRRGRARGEGDIPAADL